MKTSLWPAWCAGLLLVVVAFSGCASSHSKPVRCAAVALIDGREMALNRTDYVSVEPKLSVYLADRGMVLVSDLTSADRLATITFEPDPADPRRVNVLVLDIRENHLNPRIAARGRAKENYDLPPPPIYSEVQR